MKKMNNKGYTLVELMTVVAIVVMLAGVSFAGFSNAYATAKSKYIEMAAQNEYSFENEARQEIKAYCYPSVNNVDIDEGVVPGVNTNGNGGSLNGTSDSTTTTTTTTTAAPTTTTTAAPTTTVTEPTTTTTTTTTTTAATTTAAQFDSALLGSGVVNEDGNVAYGNNLVVNAENLTSTGRGVNSVVQNSDGSYSLRIQNDQYNTVDCTISISNGEISFTGGNKYILSGFRNDLWASDTFTLSANELNYLRTNYGLDIQF